MLSCVHDLKRGIKILESVVLKSMKRHRQEGKRNPGRPRKRRTMLEAEQTVNVPVVKRKRGRPRKNQQRSANESTPVLTRKHRPRKDVKEEIAIPTRRSKRRKRFPDTCGAYLRK
eukprot:jgi/Bigna1/129872/aug1.10_g4580